MEPRKSCNEDAVDIDRGVAALVRTMKAMRGHASWSALDVLFDHTVKAEGFAGTMPEALDLLRTLPGVRVEGADDIAASRIHSDYWKPN